MIAHLPGYVTPPDADAWLAALIEFTVANYGDPPNPAERMKWVITRIMCASALPDDRQRAIRDQLFQKAPKKGGS